MEWDGVNRRRFIRVVFPYTVHIKLIDGQKISTYTEDISMGGIKVVINQKPKVNSWVNLEIFIDTKPLVCSGKISWITEKPNPLLEDKQFYEVGIEFCELTKEQNYRLKEYVAEIKSKEVKEQRRKPYL
jgi:c-di-GMP-binding flagellar brake protein YcgR